MTAHHVQNVSLGETNHFKPLNYLNSLLDLQHFIVFFWSQYDGYNTEQRTIAYGCCQNQEAKLKDCKGVIPRSNQQEADPTNSYIKSEIMS